MAKRGNKEELVVLGLRATQAQRAWLNMQATHRKISVQAIFEELMMQEKNSPWLDKGWVLRKARPKAVSLLDMINDICEHDAGLLSIVEDQVRAFHRAALR